MFNGEFRLTELFEYNAVELYIINMCNSNHGFTQITYHVRKHLNKLPEFNEKENGYLHIQDMMRKHLPDRTRYIKNQPFLFHHTARGSIGISATVPESDYSTFIFSYPRNMNDSQAFYKLIAHVGSIRALWKAGSNYLLSPRSEEKKFCSFVADHFLIYGNKMVRVVCDRYVPVVDILFKKARASMNFRLAKLYDKEHPSIYNDVYKFVDIEVL